jgi:large subunit ribosomal protein L18
MRNTTKRERIKYRIRKRIKGSAAKPRLAVYRSNKNIYCQLIDDLDGKTLASASSKDVGGTINVESAKKVGAAIADKAKASGITTVVFDRGGYIYHGRIKALADGAREGGLQF